MDAEDVVETFVDYDIEEDLFVDDNAMQVFNEFENCEVEFPDDISMQDLDDLDTGILPRLPTIKFCNEADVSHLVVEPSSEPVAAQIHVCPSCQKSYRRKIYFDKHIQSCGKSNEPQHRNKVKSTKKIKEKERKAVAIKQKKNTKSDHILATDEELISKSSEFLTNALNAAVLDPVHNLVVGDIVTPGNKIRNLAVELLDVFNGQNSLLISKSFELVGNIATIIRSVNFLKPASTEGMWERVLNVMRDKSNIGKWEDVLCKCPSSSESTFSSLYYFIVMQLVKYIMKFENSRGLGDQHEDAPDLKLTDEEQQILYYVSGYIVFSMLKKYTKMKDRNMNSTAAIAAIQFFNSLKVKDDSKVKALTFLEYTKKWLDVLDRGGLIRVTDDMFIFIRRIENAARTCLNVPFIAKYKGEDLREAIFEELDRSPLVNKYWNSLSRFVPNKDLVQILKNQVIRKWIDIRAHAFVTAYVQLLKRKFTHMTLEQKKKSNLALSKVAEPALRKTLT